MPNIILINLSPNIISQKTLSFQTDNYKTVGDVRQKLASLVHKDIELYLVTPTVRILNHNTDLSNVYNYLNTNNVYPVLGFDIPSNKITESKPIYDKPTIDVKPPIDVKPLSPPTEVRSSSPTIDVKPLSPTTVIKPLSPPTVIKPLSPATVIKPASPPTEVKPLSPPTVIKPLSPPTVIKPLSPPTVITSTISSTDAKSFSEEEKMALGIILKELETEWLYNEPPPERSKQMVNIALKNLNTSIRYDIMNNIRDKTIDERIAYFRDLLNISDIEQQLQNLPGEIVVRIISKLSIDDIISLGAVNKYYRDLILDRDILQTKANEINYKLKTELSLREQWLDLIKYHDVHYYSPRCLTANNNDKHKCLILAAKAEKIEIMERMMPTTEEEMKKAIEDIFIAVIETANYRMIDYILDKYISYINFNKKAFIKAAIRSGDSNLYNRIKNYSSEENFLNQHEILYEAAQTGNIQTFHYHADLAKTDNPDIFRIVSTPHKILILIRDISKKKDFDMLKTILSYTQPIIDPEIRSEIADRISYGIDDPDIEALFWEYFSFINRQNIMPGDYARIFINIFSKGSANTVKKLLTIFKNEIGTIQNTELRQDTTRQFLANIVDGLKVSVNRDLEIWRTTFDIVSYEDLARHGFSGNINSDIFHGMVDNNDVARFDLLFDKGFLLDQNVYDTQAFNNIYEGIVKNDNQALFDHMKSKIGAPGNLTMIKISRTYKNYRWFKEYLQRYKPNGYRYRREYDWTSGFFDKASTMVEYLDIIELMKNNSHKLKIDEPLWSNELVLYLGEKKMWSKEHQYLYNFREYDKEDKKDIENRLEDLSIDRKQFVSELVANVSSLWRRNKVSDEEYFQLLLHIRLAYTTVSITNYAIFYISPQTDRNKVRKAVEFLQTIGVIDYEFMMLVGVHESNIELVQIALDLGGEKVKQSVIEMMRDYYSFFDKISVKNKPIWQLLIDNLGDISPDDYATLIEKLVTPRYVTYRDRKDEKYKLSDQKNFDSEINTLLDWGKSKNIITREVYGKLSKLNNIVMDNYDNKGSTMKAWLAKNKEALAPTQTANSSFASGSGFNTGYGGYNPSGNSGGFGSNYPSGNSGGYNPSGFGGYNPSGNSGGYNPSGNYNQAGSSQGGYNSTGFGGYNQSGNYGGYNPSGNYNQAGSSQGGYNPTGFGGYNTSGNYNQAGSSQGGYNPSGFGGNYPPPNFSSNRPNDPYRYNPPASSRYPPVASSRYPPVGSYNPPASSRNPDKS